MILRARQVSEYLLEMFKPLLDAPEGMKHCDLMDIFYANHPEIPVVMHPRIRRAIGHIRANMNYIGWVHYDEINNLWFFTKAGRDALEQCPDPHEFCLAAGRLRRHSPRPHWQDGSDKRSVCFGGNSDSAESAEEASLNVLPEEDGDALIEAEEADVAEEARTTFEDARAAAEKGIYEFLQATHEMVFQDIVADLLRAMGYHVHWVAPPGPDGGCDIMAFSDPIGMSKPIIKVQVKRWKNKVSAPEVKSFSANLGPNDSGLFVCLGGFTWEAELFARNFAQNLTLISLDQFVRLWISHYDKLTDTAKKRFRLEPVYYVRPEEE